jgi:4-diphosphocytidyl-2C-methyl-D-erythritol kinase
MTSTASLQAITLYDELEAHRAADGTLILEEEGIAEAEKNLVMKAARKLRERTRPAREFPAPACGPEAHPEGAGLGGGSSDAPPPSRLRRSGISTC